MFRRNHRNRRKEEQIYYLLYRAKSPFTAQLPTIRTKNLINLTHGEGVRMIPREKGLVRVYTQMGTVSDGKRVDRSQVTIEKLMAKTKEALYPFKLDFRRIDWYSC